MAVCQSNGFHGNWGVIVNFLGLKFFSGSGVYYGWVRLDVWTSSFTVKDYAYDSTPGHKILAGATSGARYGANEHEQFLSRFRNIFPYPSENRNELANSNNSNMRFNHHESSIRHLRKIEE